MSLKIDLIKVGYKQSNACIVYDNDTKDAVIVDCGGDPGLI